MKHITLTILIFAQLSLFMHQAIAMNLTPPKEYTATVENAAKALIVIQAIALEGRHHHLTIKPSYTNALKIDATVAAKDVEQQEKQYTVEKFMPFFLSQTQEEVAVKPYISGFYTIYIPQNTQFTACTPQGRLAVDASLAEFNRTNP